MVQVMWSVTGWKVNLWELMKAGERRLNMLRAFNAREGMGREADILPDKFFKPLTGGPTDGVAVGEEELQQALEVYYAMAGWDAATGIPT